MSLGLGTALALGAAGLGGSLISTGWEHNYQGLEAEKQRKWASAESQLNRDFQRDMSNTAYQRAVADMQAAGINPAMLGGGAASASSPSGGVGTGSAAAGGGENLGSGLFGLSKVVFASALDAAKESPEKFVDSIIKRTTGYDQSTRRHFSIEERHYRK